MQQIGSYDLNGHTVRVFQRAYADGAARNNYDELADVNLNESEHKAFVYGTGRSIRSLQRVQKYKFKNKFNH